MPERNRNKPPTLRGNEFVMPQWPTGEEQLAQHNLLPRFGRFIRQFLEGPQSTDPRDILPYAIPGIGRGVGGARLNAPNPHIGPSSRVLSQEALRPATNPIGNFSNYPDPNRFIPQEYRVRPQSFDQNRTIESFFDVNPNVTTLERPANSNFPAASLPRSLKGPPQYGPGIRPPRFPPANENPQAIANLSSEELGMMPGVVENPARSASPFDIARTMPAEANEGFMGLVEPPALPSVAPRFPGPNVQQSGTRFPSLETLREQNWIEARPTPFREIPAQYRQMIDDMIAANPNVESRFISDAIRRQTGENILVRDIGDYRKQNRVRPPDVTTQDITRMLENPNQHRTHHQFGVSDPFRMDPLSGYRTRQNPISGIPRGPGEPAIAPPEFPSNAYAGEYNPLLYDQVLPTLDELGVPVEKVTGRGQTAYVRVTDVDGSPVTIRVPNDRHLANPASYERYAPNQFFDLGTNQIPNSGRIPSPRNLQRRLRFRGGRVMNEAGELYGQSPETFRDLIRWRFPNRVSQTGQNFLTPPGSAPMPRPPGPVEPTPNIPDPNQLQLLGAAGALVSTPDILRFLANGPQNQQ